MIPFTRANAQWVFHGFLIALQFTLQSCVYSATRHNIHNHFIRLSQRTPIQRTNQHSKKIIVADTKRGKKRLDFTSD